MERATKEHRWLVVLAGFLIFGIGTLGKSNIASAQTRLRERVKPVKIVQIYGRDTLEVGEAETYRVRVIAPYETAYTWHISDGTELGGNPIVFRFSQPGTYKLVAIAANPTGKDTASIDVFVRGKMPPPALASNKKPPAAEKSGHKSTAASAKSTKEVVLKVTAPSTTGLRGKDEASGNYTWVIATYFQRKDAEALANAYRAVGYRANIFVDTGGKGSTVFRVCLGRFDSEQQAMQAKKEVMDNGVENPILHHTKGA